MWTIVNYLKWKNVFSALGSSYRFTWNSIFYQLFRIRYQKTTQKMLLHLRISNEWKLLSWPARFVCCHASKSDFSAEFKEINSRIICSHFSEQNLQKPVFMHFCSFALRVILLAIPKAWIHERPKLWGNFTSFGGFCPKMAYLLLQSVPQLPNSPIFLDYSIFFRFSSCCSQLIQYRCTTVDYQTVYAIYSSFRFLRVSNGVFDTMKRLIFLSVQF